VKPGALTLTLLLLLSPLSYAETPPEDIRQLFNDGLTYLNQGDAIRAARSLRRVMEINPSIPQAHNALGIAYLRQERYNKAIESFKNAVELDSQYAEGYFNLGSAYLRGDYEAEYSQKYFSKTLEVDPNFPNVYASLGWLHLEKTNDFHAAETSFSKALKQNPQDIRSLYGIGIAYIFINKPEKTIFSISKLRAMDQEQLAKT